MLASDSIVVIILFPTAFDFVWVVDGFSSLIFPAFRDLLKSRQLCLITLGLRNAVLLDVNMFVRLKNFDVVIWIFDSETLDQLVLVFDGPAFISGLLFRFLQLLRGRIFLESDVEKHSGESRLIFCRQDSDT